MSKAALILVGIAAAAGLALTVNRVSAEPETRPRRPTQDDPDAEDGEVIDTPDLPPKPEEGSPGPSPGAGSGAPPMHSLLPDSPRADLIPPQVRNVNLSGNEVYEYQGISNFGAGFDYDTWMIYDTLNGMNMVVHKSVISPEDWIAMFIHIDPPPSEPPSHMIVFAIGDGPNRDWKLLNLAKVSHL